MPSMTGVAVLSSKMRQSLHRYIPSAKTATEIGLLRHFKNNVRNVVPVLSCLRLAKPVMVYCAIRPAANATKMTRSRRANRQISLPFMIS